MLFIAMTLLIRPEQQSASLKPGDAVYLHAVICQLISRENPEAGRALHDMQRNKLVTMSILNNERYGVKLRLTFMAEDGLMYADLLINALAVQPELRLGRTLWHVEAADLADAEWSRISTWADLLTDEIGRYIRFSFVTPTAIMKRDQDGDRFTALYPDPVDLFSGLLRRWRGLGGLDLPNDLESFVRAGGCVVSNYHLQTVKFQTPDRTQIGFVGRVGYECRKGDPVYIAALNGLARLAFFSGVGYQTSRGMGTVQTAITD